MMRRSLSSLSILTLIACCSGCETNISRNKEIWDAYQPMLAVGRALARAFEAGQAPPDSEEALAEWVAATPFLADAEQREKAREFLARGVYRTDVRDAKGKHHGHVAMYYIVVSSGSLICTYGSGDGWVPMHYAERDARQLFGDALVDSVIARAKRSR